MFDFSSSDYQELCHEVLQKATQAGATSCETGLRIDEGFEVTVRMGDVETLEHHVEQALMITVYVGHKSGSTSTTDISKQAISQAVEKALAIAKFTQDDPFSGLAEAKDLAREIPDCDLFHPWDITPDQAIRLANECEHAGLSFDQRINNSEGASFNTNRSKKYYANSLGFSGTYQSTSHSLNCALIAEADGKMQRDFDYSYARRSEDLWSAQTVGRNAASRTVQRLGTRTLKTQQAPVIFRHDLAAGLLYSFVRAISGSSIYRKSSFLLDQFNQQVFPNWLDITQLPHLPKGLASKPFDSEGVATQDRELVSEGVLKSYILSSYSARKLGLTTTGNAGGAQNLLVSHHDLDFCEMLKEMGTGLLVTELIGQGINLVTGDYSRGAFGYWVQQGEIQFPVEGITIAGNLKEMFNNIQLIANDVEMRSTIQTGSILVKEMTIAGK